MTTVAIHNQAAFFDSGTESLPPPAMKATRRFVPATPTTKLRFVPGAVRTEKLRFVPRVDKPSRAKAPVEPRSMMRFGSIGVAALALAGSIFVTSSAPASSRLPVEEPRAPQAEVEFATEVPAPVVAAPAVVEAAPAPTTRARRAGSSSVAAPTRVRAADENVDELSDTPSVVVPVAGPRPNPF